MGGLSTDYGIGPPSVLLRVGAGYVALGILTAILHPNTVRKAVLSAMVTIAAIFVAGLCVIYYDLQDALPTRPTLTSSAERASPTD